MFVRETPSAFSVNREAYVSPAAFEVERRAVWDRCWLYVGHESEIPRPNDFLVRDVGGRPLILCRDADGDVRVHLNTCTHRGAELCRVPSGNAERFTCVYHAWTFSNRGDLAVLPDPDSYPGAFPRDDYALVSPPHVDTYRGFVFVSYDPGIEDLVGYLAGAAAYLDLVADQCEAGMEVLPGVHDYSTRANWKLLVENSADGYHGMPVHGSYFEFLKKLGDDISAKNRYGGSRAVDLGNGHAVIRRTTPMARAVARWAPSLGDAIRPELESRRARLEERLGGERAAEVAETDSNLIVFPNLIVLNAMGVVIRAIEPVAVDEVRALSWILAPVDQSERERRSMLEQSLLFWGPAGMATPDDADLLESVQRGLRAWREAPWSDVSRGLGKDEPTSRDENQIQAFWRRYDQLMEEAVASDGATGVETGVSLPGGAS